MLQGAKIRQLQADVDDLSADIAVMQEVLVKNARVMEMMRENESACARILEKIADRLGLPVSRVPEVLQ